jgi:hypothetical protein
MAIKTVIVLLVGLTLASVRLVEAQQPTKIPRIAYLSAGSASSQASRIEVFKQGLRDLGYAPRFCSLKGPTTLLCPGFFAIFAPRRG